MTFLNSQALFLNILLIRLLKQKEQQSTYKNNYKKQTWKYQVYQIEYIKYKWEIPKTYFLIKQIKAKMI